MKQRWQRPAGRCIAGLMLALLAMQAQAQASKTLRLASLEWRPYVGPTMEQGGLSAVIVNAAARQFGREFIIDYFPWNRAMQLGWKDARYAGYFPAYYTAERQHQCHFSASLGSSTIGFAHLRDKPLQWRHLQDLGGMRIGVVAGYSNGAQFDELVKQGRLNVDVTPSDLLNLRKLLARRVDIIVIDKLVLRYLLLTDPALYRDKHLVAFGARPLAELGLHICFQHTAEGQRLQQAFDKRLMALQLQKIENAYFQLLESKLDSTP